MNTQVIQQGIKDTTYFTSDWHLGDRRLGTNGLPNVFYRPFENEEQQNVSIITNLFKEFSDGDTLWHLGDVLVEKTSSAVAQLEELKRRFPSSEFNLVVGNYDDDKIDFLKNYFHNIYQGKALRLVTAEGEEIDTYLNHYPRKCKPKRQVYDLCLTGHIHGLWKIQEKIINVGVDTWHFKPISLDTILFCYNAMNSHYDENVFF